MRFLLMYGIVLYLFIALLASGCSSPAQTLNVLTPDRLGYGIMDGSMNIKGTGNMNTIFNSHVGDVTMDMEGSSETSIVYLEWDIPSWNDDVFESKEDKYMRDRIRHLNYRMSMMEAEEKNNKTLDEWYAGQ